MNINLRTTKTTETQREAKIKSARKRKRALERIKAHSLTRKTKLQSSKAVKQCSEAQKMRDREFANEKKQRKEEERAY